jgi:hypothetical protein
LIFLHSGCVFLGFVLYFLCLIVVFLVFEKIGSNKNC